MKMPFLIILQVLLALCFVSTSFADENQWLDVSDQFSVEQKRTYFDRINREMVTYVTVTNTSETSVASSVRLSINDPSIPLTNSDGILENGDYIYHFETALIVPEQSHTFKLSFRPTRKKLTFSQNIQVLLLPNGDSNESTELISKSDGGVVSLDNGIHLVVPPNSLDHDQAITLAYTTSPSGGYRLELAPEGTQFLKSVSVVLPIANDIDSTDVYFSSQSLDRVDDGVNLNQMTTLPKYQIDNNTVAVEIAHFSRIFVGPTTFGYPVIAIPYHKLQPADIIYSLSTKRDKIGWLFGHAQMYGGEVPNESNVLKHSLFESTFRDNGLDCDGEPASPLPFHGVDKRCDLESSFNYYTNFENPHYIIGAMRHRSMTDEKSRRIVDQAKELVDSRYTLVGIDLIDVYSCVGFVEEIFNRAGLFMSFGTFGRVNIITPIEQFFSLNLDPVQDIYVKVNEDIDIPIYGFARDYGTFLNDLTPAVPLDAGSFIPPGLGWSDAYCRNDPQALMCKPEDYVPGSVAGTIASSAAGQSYLIAIEVATSRGDRVRQFLSIHVEAEEDELETIRHDGKEWIRLDQTVQFQSYDDIARVCSTRTGRCNGRIESIIPGDEGIDVSGFTWAKPEDVIPFLYHLADYNPNSSEELGATFPYDSPYVPRILNTLGRTYPFGPNLPASIGYTRDLNGNSVLLTVASDCLMPQCRNDSIFTYVNHTRSDPVDWAGVWLYREY